MPAVEKKRASRPAAELENLPPKKLAYVQGRLDGKSKKQAALDAGFSQTMAEHAADKIETKDVREAFARLVREMVPAELIAKTIAEGMAATETKFFSHEGVVQDKREVPDWAERRQYAELAAEYGGYHSRSSKEERGGGGVIIVLPRSEPEPENRTLEAAPEKQGPIVVLPNQLEGSDGQPGRSQPGPVEPEAVNRRNLHL